MSGRACALTGHRALPAQFDRRALFDEFEALLKEGYTDFFCGMAEGFDLLSLQFLVELKARYPIYIEACVPFRGQENSFSRENRTLYRDLIEKCDKVTVLFEKYRNGCFLARNRYMVDCCDLLFAYCTKETGGTAYTVRYAEKAEKPVRFFRTDIGEGLW